ncbi:snRNA-activating protein complex subunit 1 [Achroia grisella]|uniref:snRNA-activating protein complex subunit 1 n=1 Tax=Achroia grisella TaxID=688607 RepID=UPI0027D2388F|nr:snRNA-activating protein complex subunit 1 [Achroia grisella]
MSSRRDFPKHHPHYYGYIADGFHSDCTLLIQRCMQSDKINYETFCRVWKEMQFDHLYHGRLSGAEIAELSEELIQIAKQFMLSDNSNFEESVAGLFLVYALLNLQPYSGFAALRIVPDDVESIARLEMIARRERRLDMLYILGSVLTQGPCEYHAAPREYGMEPSYKKYLEGYSDVDRMRLRFKGVFVRHPEELDVLRELAGITSRYVESKAALLGDGKELDPSLNFINKDLATELDVSLKNVIAGMPEIDPESNDEPKSPNAQDIKARAMKGIVGPMKHLVGISNRRHETIPTKASPYKRRFIPEESSSEDSDGAKSPSKLSLSLRKRKVPPTRKLKKRSRKKSTSSSDNDGYIPLLSNNAEADTNDDINLKEFHQLPNIVDMPTENKETAEHNLHIQIDSVPVYIKTDENHRIQIEIIDSAVKKNCENATNNAGESSVNAGSSVVQETATENVEENKKSESFIIKPTKREQKKSLLKSKFKRMGMLPVANFKEVEYKKRKRKSSK